MSTSVVLYENNGNVIQVNDKFIYEDSIYKVFKEGIALFDTKYYTSNKPIKLKKKDLTTKKKGKTEYLVRFFTLEFAPEEYLINNGFKKIL